MAKTIVFEIWMTLDERLRLTILRARALIAGHRGDRRTELRLEHRFRERISRLARKARVAR